MAKGSVQGPKQVALYLRVSTDNQTTDNQRRELEAVALRHGWEVVKVFEDAAISGAKGRDKRPGLDALLKGISRRDFDLVAAWSVDRLGRSLKDLVSFLEDLKANGVDLYLHQQGLNSATAAGKAMFQMCGVFAEFEREILVARIHAGLARAKAAGVRLGPKFADLNMAKVESLVASGMSIRAAAREIGASPETVRRRLALANRAMVGAEVGAK